MKLLLLENSNLTENIRKNFDDKAIVNYNFQQFKDGEMCIDLCNPVRNEDVIVVLSISNPVNDNLMKTLIAVDALKRASAKSITLVVPYLGYCRQDRKVLPRQPITAKLVADLLQTSGVNRVITCDLHAAQIEGFYNVPLDNLPILKILGRKWYKTREADYDPEKYCVVSPDHGGFTRAKNFADQAHIKNIAIISKYREKANEVASMRVIGDVKDKICIIIDDIIDTGGTLIKASEELKKMGSKEVYALCTHGVLSGNAIEKVTSSAALDKLLVSNSIDRENEVTSDKIKYIDISDVIVSVINVFKNGGSFFDSINGVTGD